MGIEISEIGRLGKDAQAQIAAKLAVGAVEKRKRSKYGNQSATRGKLRFDSQKEARRYDELILLLKAGEIFDLKLQPQFTLQESYITPEGERVRAIRYVADFSYCRAKGWEYGNTLTVEDVKSTATRTAQYKIKRKMFKAKYGFDITEV